MKLLQINCSVVGSTGKIMFSLEDIASEYGFEVLSCAPSSNKACTRDYYVIESAFGRKISAGLDYFCGVSGGFAKFASRKLVKKIKEFDPDIIHLHNLHGSYVNLGILFRYLKESKKKIIWTLHDCWSFTGRCPHFVLAGCDRWMTGCYKCKYPKFLYPRAKLDKTKKMWQLKKSLFSGLDNLQIVSPSNWLADLVKKSFLKDYPINVINNGVDLSVFTPTESNFREKNGINKNCFILLGVAFDWGRKKGLDVFVELSKRLDGDFQIVLVGTDDKIDGVLPKNIISIHKTNNQKELAEIYSAADLFVNPTREENFCLVNLEALACGTPVVTFDTGGSPESLDKNCGSIVEYNDIDALENEIVKIRKFAPYSTNACVERAKQFDVNQKYIEYIRLYKKLVNK